jgi:hypothetical protein
MKLRHKGHLNTSNIFPMRFFLNSKISLLILYELEEPRFWEKWEKSTKLKGLEHGFISRLEVDDETQRSTQTHRRNQRKTPQIMR